MYLLRLSLIHILHIYLDFETGSDVDLMVEGRARYMHHPSTYVQICSFQIDDEPMITETVHTGFQSFAKVISEYVITKQAKIVAFKDVYKRQRNNKLKKNILQNENDMA